MSWDSEVDELRRPGQLPAAGRHQPPGHRVEQLPPETVQITHPRRDDPQPPICPRAHDDPDPLVEVQREELPTTFWGKVMAAFVAWKNRVSGPPGSEPPAPLPSMDPQQPVRSI